MEHARTRLVGCIGLRDKGMHCSPLSRDDVIGGNVVPHRFLRSLAALNPCPTKIYSAIIHVPPMKRLVLTMVNNVSIYLQQWYGEGQAKTTGWTKGITGTTMGASRCKAKSTAQKIATHSFNQTFCVWFNDVRQVGGVELKERATQIGRGYAHSFAHKC
jgi:hypothetical protein